MKKTYQLYSRRQDIGRFISQLHNEEFLAIGILDNGTKAELLETVNWYAENFNHHLHVITDRDRFSPESLMETFPEVAFLVFESRPTLSESLNALANECMTTYFLVLGSDCEMVQFEWKSVLEKFQKDNHPAVLCPICFNKSKELVPTIRVPHMSRDQVYPMSFIPGRKPTENLYPFMGYGIYDRAMFQRMHGFDELIRGDYWQAMDYGTRCWLYGNPIFTVEDIALIFPNKQFLIEDRSEMTGVGRFYTKALSVHRKGGKLTYKKTYKFDKHLMNSEIRNHLVLYKTDYETLCALWRVPEDNE